MGELCDLGLGVGVVGLVFFKGWLDGGEGGWGDDFLE